MTLTPASSRGNATAIDGVTVTGTPSAGQVITATGATAATWQAGGGASPTQETFTGVTVIPHGDTGAPLTWVRGAGAVLLNLTAPTAPTIVASGTYALTVFVLASGSAASGTMLAQILYPTGANVDQMTPMTSDAGTVGAPRVSLAATFKATAGDSLSLYGMQDSPADDNFSILATLVKLA